VRDCGVVGLPDEKWGERVVAVVQPQEGAHVTGEELIAYAKERIGSVKAPKQVHVWPDLPRSTVGKVLKADIRKRLRSAGS
jgi:acyl-CoA synthetase (AMP-forming)/AMP-acid ligase II